MAQGVTRTRCGRQRFLAAYLLFSFFYLVHLGTGRAQEVDADAPTSDIADTNPDPTKPTPAGAAQLGFEPSIPIPVGVKIHRVIVTPGPEGSTVEFTGSIAGDGFDTMACNNAGLDLLQHRRCGVHRSYRWRCYVDLG